MSNMSTMALSAKAKAMFGKRLKNTDYDQLLQKKSIAEIASYLKEKTYFQEVLKDISEKNIHRGQLEALIRMDAFQRYSNLLRYADSNGNDFYRYGIMDNEIHQILACIRSIASNDKIPFVAKMPTYINHLLSFDLKALSSVSSYDELLNVLKGTPYASILVNYKTDDMENFDYPGCENALMNYYYEHIIEKADKYFHGDVKKNIKEIILTEIELDNITKIYRLKKYFNESNENIKKMITPIYMRIPKKELDGLIDRCDADEFFEELAKTSYKNYMDSSNFAFIEYHTQSINYNLNKRHLAFSTNPDLVLMSYMVLSEIEIKNVIDIIEGVRYNITPDKIRKLLIY